MKLDFNFNFVDLDGNEIQQNAGKLLASALASASKGDALKFWDWALKLNAGTALDLDASDKNKLKSFIEDNEGFTVLAKAQLLAVFS